MEVKMKLNKLFEDPKRKIDIQLIVPHVYKINKQDVLNLCIFLDGVQIYDKTILRASPKLIKNIERYVSDRLNSIRGKSVKSFKISHTNDTDINIYNNMITLYNNHYTKVELERGNKDAILPAFEKPISAEYCK